MWHISTGYWNEDKPEVLCGRDYSWRRMYANHLGSGMPCVFKGTDGVTDRKFVSPAVEKNICPECLVGMEAGLTRPGQNIEMDEVPF